MSSTALKSSLSYSNFTAEQNQALKRLYEYDYTLLIASKGFGKCAIAQTAAQELLDEGELSRVLVIAPPKVCALTWANEHLKWDHLEEVGLATGTPPQRRAVIDGDARIVVMSADTVPQFFTDWGLEHNFDGLIIDEISRFKSVGTAGVKAMRYRMEPFKWRVGLSATPVAESGTDIYSQALLLDSSALGRNQERFLAKFFMSDYMGYKYEIQPGAEALLAEALRDLVWVAPSTDYEAGLPRLVEHQVPVMLPGVARRAYEELAQTMLIEAVEDVEAVNEAVLSGKLQQMASGFVYGENKRPTWFHREKFIQLAQLVHSIDRESPVLIMYQYIAELTKLKQMYRGLPVLGDNPVKYEMLWNAGKLPVMAIHPRSAGHGLNLQHGGADLICLGPCWSSDLWEQVIGRLWRRGQTREVTRWTLVAQGTIDGVILLRLEDKSENENLLMDHLREVTKTP